MSSELSIFANKKRNYECINTKFQIWDWFGNHGAFIGGTPMTPTYNEDCLTDPKYTPFERFYVSLDTPSGFIALRLRPFAHKQGRIFDSMELVTLRSEMENPKTDLWVYHLPRKVLDSDDEADDDEMDADADHCIPVARLSVTEEELLREFPNIVRWV